MVLFSPSLLDNYIKLDGNCYFRDNTFLTSFSSHVGGVFYAAPATQFAIGLRQKDRPDSGCDLSGCIGASHRSRRTSIQ